MMNNKTYIIQFINLYLYNVLLFYLNYTNHLIKLIYSQNYIFIIFYYNLLHLMNNFHFIIFHQQKLIILIFHQ